MSLRIPVLSAAVKQPSRLSRQYNRQNTLQTSLNSVHFGNQGIAYRLPPAIQLKVRGVTMHQRSFDPAIVPISDNINRLSEGPWKDGQELTAKVDSLKGQILLEVPGIGPIGRIPDQIAPHLRPLIEEAPKDFRFELSNLVAGTTKGAETIGVRINLIYTGSNPKIEQASRKAFTTILNNPSCKDFAMLYQPAVSPDQVLDAMMTHETKTNGAESAWEMKTAIDKILTTLRDPEYKRILLVGHCKPDGDTLGSIVGLKNAILLMDPSRQVDCAVDDKLPGLFRDTIPGLETIKHPNNPERIAEVAADLAQLQASTPQSPKIPMLQRELTALRDPKNHLKPDTQYDLVIAVDIPTPKRFTKQFKPYLDKAFDVVYIDHHPHRANEWDAALSETGLDVNKARTQNHWWVADSVAACAQMVAVLAVKLVPQLEALQRKKQNAAEILPESTHRTLLGQMVANLIAGIFTDTGSFTRTANLKPQDTIKPAEQRPNFWPEGLSKWLMALTQNLGGDSQVTKKWLRETVTYDIPDKTLEGDAQTSARAEMIRHAIAQRQMHPELGLGIVQANYTQMRDVWDTAREVDPEVTLLDIQNAFKYCEVMGALRTNPALHPSAESHNPAKTSYVGPYDNQRIAVLICQDKQAGELDEKLDIAECNGLRLSIRSADGTTDAEMLASLFGGGGHGSASGGRIDFPGVTLESKLGVLINGRPVLNQDPKTILSVLEKNYAILHHPKLTDAQKKAQLTPIQVVSDPNGKTCTDLVTAMVSQMRVNK